MIATLAIDLGAMIDAARRQVTVTANAALTTLYWQIGQRVRNEVLDGRRAEYGAEIVAAVGRELEAGYGRGFGEKSLRHMVRFAEAFPDPEIVSALRRQLSWSHFRQLVYLKDDLRRSFYAEMCRVEGWSTRELAEKIDGMLFERTALSKKPEELVRAEPYLRWLDRHERQPTEEAPLGIILCAGKKRETALYLDLDTRGIHVAEYLTELPVARGAPAEAPSRDRGCARQSRPRCGA